MPAMIIWSGKGFLVAVFVFGCSLIANLITNNVSGGELYWEQHRWPFGASLLVSAMLTWFVGDAWRRKQERVLIDRETGQEVRINEGDHSLFFVPMHWWGPILAALGVGVIGFDLWKQSR
jgi:hypothetical protein